MGATVGPVVGKVTATTARVLLETDSDAEAVCILEDHSGARRESRLRLQKGVPAAFAVDGLEPERTYEIRFEGVSGVPPGRVRTLPEAPGRLTLAAVSCNDPRSGEGMERWADLHRRWVEPGEVDLVLHLGDQVYADEAFEDALALLRRQPFPGPERDGAILESYRRLYRSAWSDPSLRPVLAQVPNLMIWDDHEIRDGWGLEAADADPDSPERQVGALARRAYREYQRQLWDDLDPAAPPASGFEDHLHVWGPFGILFLDVRGGRSFGRDDSRPFLGAPQWKRVRSALGKRGAFARVRALVVVSTVPLALFEDPKFDGSPIRLDHFEDEWSYRSFQPEQREMLEALRKWKEAGKGDRELLVLCGDLHAGGISEVKYEGQTCWRQLITSPMSQKRLHALEFLALSSKLTSVVRADERFTFHHGRFVRSHNYGIVAGYAPARGGARLEPSLAAAK
jgi:hypothetical protein